MRQCPSVIDTPAGRLRYTWTQHQKRDIEKIKSIQEKLPHSSLKQRRLRTSHLAPYRHDEVLLEFLAAEAVLAFIHGGSQPATLPDGSVPHPLLLPPLALPLCRSRHKHVIQRVVVTICLPHHLEWSRSGGDGDDGSDSGDKEQEVVSTLNRCVTIPGTC